MRMMKIAVLLCLTAFWAAPAALAGENNCLQEVAASTADALAADDADMLKQHLLTYEEGIGISEKLKRVTKKQFGRDCAETIAASWREVRQEKVMVDHVEIQDVIIAPVRGATPPGYYATAVVMPVLVHEKREMRPPMLRLLFVQIGGRWKYLYRK